MNLPRGLTIGFVVGVVALAGHNAVATPTKSPYWLAGWLPKHEHLIDAHAETVPAAGYPQNVASYGKRRAHEDIQISAYPDHRVGQIPECNANTTTRRTVRGHPGCEGTLIEEAPFGTFVMWQERPDLAIDVEVYLPLTAADARRIAENVKPTDAATWGRLVTSTSLITEADPTMSRVPAGRGRLNGSTWVLTALIPRGYPLGPDDRRGACDELSFRNERASTCADSGQSSRFVRLASKVFVFGSVPPAVRRVTVHLFDATNPATGTATPQLATATTVAAKPARNRFFAAPLPDGNCGAIVFDADHPASQVGFAPGPPFDAVCSGRDPNLPPQLPPAEAQVAPAPSRP